MRRAPFLIGVAIGVAAIVLAWSRGAATNDAGRTTPKAPFVLGSPAPTTASPGSDAGIQPPAATHDGPAGRTLPSEGALAARSDGGGGDLDGLRARALMIPVEGLGPQALRDDFSDARVGHAHEALDISAPRGTRVLAADGGFVAKLFTSVRGGLTVYQFDPTQTWCYYYAHLDRYAPGLREGRSLRKGDLVGFVGTTGNAPPQAPHLHFAIFRLGPEKRWWQGVAVNPYPVLAGAGLRADSRE